MGFDDCKKERDFTDIEEMILRTISLLFAASVSRHEMNSELLRTTESALVGSRAKSEFLSNISHEIRTPLNAITGMSALARRTDDINEVRRCLDHIDAAARQLLSIINDVLDMSKIEAGKIELMEEPFELCAMLSNVKSIIGVQAEQKGVRLHAEMAPDLPAAVLGDETRLAQIVINLLSNAIKFTPKEGDVFFEASCLESEPGGFQKLLFVVRDTGIGISPEQLPTLFNKFEQAGRDISKTFVEMMRGSLDVSSVLGKGSTFSARVCLKREQADSLHLQRTENQSSENIFAGYRALLVEDVEVNREIVLGMMGGTGLQIDMAEDGKRAVDILKEDIERYDLVLMDVNMPVMDGHTASRTIRSFPHPRAKTLPIITMTANAFSSDVQLCRDAGMDDHIAKPVEYNKLLRKIERYLPIKHPHTPPPSQKEGETGSLHRDIEGLDVSQGIAMTGGSAEGYQKILAVFLRDGQEETEQIRRCREQGEEKLYTIYVHALKSALGSIGAPSLSNQAADLERASREGDTSFLDNNTEPFLSQLETLMRQIELSLSQPEEGEPITEVHDQKLQALQKAIEVLDMNATDALLLDLAKGATGFFREQLQELEQLLLLSEYEKGSALIERLLKENR